MTVRELIIALLHCDMRSKVNFELNGESDVTTLEYDGIECDMGTNEVFILLSKDWGGNHMRRDLHGKQFTRGELSFIRYMLKKCIWTFQPMIYEKDGVVEVKERSKHIIRVIDELLYDIDKSFDE